jgi:CTP:molybdopterin cytidylyltransferase MocA
VEPYVAGVLLAAGAGSRLGQPKATVEVRGEPLARRGVALLRDGGAQPIVVVTGAVAVDLPGVLVVHNPGWRSGMGSSLAAGLAMVPDSCEAAVIALVDQPLVGPEAVRRLIAAYRAGARVVVAAYDGRPRNPVLIAREHWPEVTALAVGDTGARPFLRAHPALVTPVECGDTGSPDDVDTRADLERIEGLAGQGGAGPGEAAPGGSGPHGASTAGASTAGASAGGASAGGASAGGASAGGAG